MRSSLMIRVRLTSVLILVAGLQRTEIRMTTQHVTAIHLVIVFGLVVVANFLDGSYIVTSTERLLSGGILQVACRATA